MYVCLEERVNYLIAFIYTEENRFNANVMWFKKMKNENNKNFIHVGVFFFLVFLLLSTL